MTLDQVLADSLAATTAAGGHTNPFGGNTSRTTSILQALIVYSGLQEIAQNQVDIAAIGDSLTTMITLLDTIKVALLAGQPVNLEPLISEMILLRDAIHRS